MDPKAYEVVTSALRVLEAESIDYVLIGGWAAFAYGSKVPSADTDVLVATAKMDQVNRLIQSQTGATVGPGGQFETLGLDSLNTILGTDSELGEADRGYVPSKLLAGRTQKLKLDLPKLQLTAVVPLPQELAFMKLKALHDRVLSWRAHRDSSLLAQLPPDVRPMVLAKSESYYRQKAAKDLYDIAFLCSTHCQIGEVAALAETSGLRDDLVKALQNPQLPLIAIARDLADGQAKTQQWLDDLRNGSIKY